MNILSLDSYQLEIVSFPMLPRWRNHCLIRFSWQIKYIRYFKKYYLPHQVGNESWNNGLCISRKKTECIIFCKKNFYWFEIQHGNIRIKQQYEKWIWRSVNIFDKYIYHNYRIRNRCLQYAAYRNNSAHITRNYGAHKWFIKKGTRCWNLWQICMIIP